MRFYSWLLELEFEQESVTVTTTGTTKTNYLSEKRRRRAMEEPNLIL